MSESTRLGRITIVIACIASLGAASVIDYLTGYDLVFSAVYLVPACLCAWYIGRRAVAMMSVACAVVSWFVDAGHPYSNASIQYWNALSCLLVSLFGGLMLYRLKKILAERKQINKELKNAMEELKRSTDEITKLQNGLQVICAWTKQIKVGDQWMSSEEFLSTQLHLKLSHGISPEGERKFLGKP